MGKSAKAFMVGLPARVSGRLPPARNPQIALLGWMQMETIPSRTFEANKGSTGIPVVTTEPTLARVAKLRRALERYGQLLHATTDSRAIAVIETLIEETAAELRSPQNR